MSDVGLPQSFDCEGVYVNHNGHLALRRGPRDMLSQILKTNVIAVQKLVGLLTSIKSYSLSKKAKEGEKAMKQAGYLETSRVVNAGAQGVPYERLKFAASEMVARAQLVLAMGGQLEPSLKRGATFILENALASDEVDAQQVSRAIEAMAMDDILGVSLEQSRAGLSDQARSSCNTRDLLNETAQTVLAMGSTEPLTRNNYRKDSATSGACGSQTPTGTFCPRAPTSHYHKLLGCHAGT